MKADPLLAVAQRTKGAQLGACEGRVDQERILDELAVTGQLLGLGVADGQAQEDRGTSGRAQQ